MREVTFDEFGKLNLKHLGACVEGSSILISYSWKRDKRKAYLNRKHQSNYTAVKFCLKTGTFGSDGYVHDCGDDFQPHVNKNSYEV